MIKERNIAARIEPKGDTENMKSKVKSLIIGLTSGLTAFFAAVGVIGAFIFIVKKAGARLNIIK